jgi:hypothetical protein
MYELCDRSDYIYDMRVSLVKQRNVVSTGVTPTHGSVLERVREADGVGHKIFMDKYVFHLTKTFP